MKIILNIFFIYLLSTINIYSQIEDKYIFKAGASQKNITPSIDLIKGRRINDSLYVKSIVLTDGKHKIALSVVDNQGIPQYIIEEAKRKIEQNTGISKEFIMISSTHTHSGLIAHYAPLNIDNIDFTPYQNIIINQLVESISEANNNLISAKLGCGKIIKPEYVFNRRWYTKSLQKSPFGCKDSVVMNPGLEKLKDLVKPAGPIDPEISFFAIKSLNEEPIAIFSNYSVHYIGAEGNDISADYFGFVAQHISNLLNVDTKKQPFVSIMSNGTSGDINNINPERTKPHITNYVRTNEISKDIANSIINEYKKIKFESNVTFDVISDEINLSLRKGSKQIDKNIRLIQSNKSKKTLFNSQEKNYAERLVRLKNIYPNKISIPIQSFRIGSVAFSAIPFEVFAETGLELKEKSPFENYFTIGIANGHWGYLPTPKQFEKGGYETWHTVARVQENASELITEKILKQLKTINK